MTPAMMNKDADSQTESETPRNAVSPR